MKGKIIFDDDEIEFVDFVDRIPSAAKNGQGSAVQARLYLPKEWVGKKVRVFKLED